MRTSFESRAFYLRLTVIFFALFLSNGAFASYSWTDCGDKLSRVFTYHSVTLYPSTVIAGEQVAINVAAVIGTEKVWTGNQLRVEYNGEEVLSVNTTDMCELTRVLQCPFKAMPLSYTEIYNVPHLPSGSYTFQVRNIFGKEYFQTEIGCLSVTVDVQDPTIHGCTYKSFAEIELGNIQAHWEQTDPASRTIGSWMIVGPAWGDASSGFPWGKFKSVNASTDLLMSGGYDPKDLVWGLYGNLYSKSINTDGTIETKYNGTFFVGYNGNDFPQFLSLDNPLLSGFFDWTFLNKPSSSEFTVSGTVSILPALGFQALGWPYPLGFGRLDDFALSTLPDGSSYILSASKTYSTCLPPSTSSLSTNNIKTDTSPTSNWNADQKWALALGVVGAFLVLLIPFLLWLAWRQRKNQYYSGDDDLQDPLKPDYGSLAINEIIDDDDLPRQ